MSAQSGLFNDLRILWQLSFNRVRGNTHEERLESFYRHQASGYDAYRKRLLHGRTEMIQSLPISEGQTWIDMGAGTGENVEHMGDKLPTLGKVYLLDLCQPLLKIGQERIERNGWTNVEPVHGDATQYVPPEGSVDCVTFSYSLTMIPDWFAAVDHAYRLLKPGGVIGIADFYVARKFAAEDRRRHGWLTRTFWQTFFSIDNVFLSGDHIPYLHQKFEPVVFKEAFGSMPIAGFVKAPYYIFIGRKPEE
ncbi:class I SAM-dependent methyltransferase [Calycomorphotria hydatis]|uniref:Ubiquinone/menaquinone biosynthesis C-methyltransferase UbiE n=1 Tax=Calycomorphotria hydatis TaxID=2528027 RepID=A0A517TBR9_9PLAN|nr:class I SAM-dependent methyltransferase [Calycomorphotria hydatis]QDT65822.1 Ubiquinone/menaquinone biosynthesis C-methyltransferase UbiE [Calycomorphotria hydatis]